MSLDPQLLAERVSAETGLDFEGMEGRESDGTRWLEIRPADHPPAQTFAIRTSIGWRRLDVVFRLGRFASELMEGIGSTDAVGRATFRAVLDSCRQAGADVTLSINGIALTLDDEAIWQQAWRTLGLAVGKGMLAINDGNVAEDMRQIEIWTCRTAAAVLALLPLEAEADGQDITESGAAGLPEGALTRVEVNRYERDRRNRAVALAIHGYCCKACDLDLGSRYGSAAAGLIEVHHVTPVSEVGEDYMIDPATDLTPLCPNCHAVAHRRKPPFSAEELRLMIGASAVE